MLNSPLFAFRKSGSALALSIFCTVMLAPSPAQAWPADIPASVADAFSEAGIPEGAVGMFVQEVGQNTPFFAFNPQTAFNPASTMKLVTTSAGLDLLGPAFSWKTQAYAEGVLRGDVLEGDLVLKGSGDPKLVFENFWMFLRQIRARGVREIRGNVLLDRSNFEEPAQDAAGFDGDPLKSYNVGPDALLLNYKAISLRFVPDPARGKVLLAMDPPMAGFRVPPPPLAMSGACGDWQQKLDAQIKPDGIRFSGAFPVACGEKVWHLHPYTMSQTGYFDAVFRQLWHDLGGVLKGGIKTGTASPQAGLLVQWESPNLPEVIRDINKYSNNVMARQLFLSIANNYLQQPATTQRAAGVVKTWLAGKGIDAPELVLDNGSGLSRNERVSAATLGRLLVANYRSPTMPEFIASMPLVGYDGTMRKRLKTQGVSGNAHIKTGSLNDVRSVAGYVLAASGKRYAVVCLVNHAKAGASAAGMDSLLQWVYEKG